MDTFELWMDEIDGIMQGMVGCSVYDLPDCLYRDWFEDGVPPPEAATRVIKKAMG